MILRNLRSGCIRLTGRLLTNQSSKSWSRVEAAGDGVERVWSYWLLVRDQIVSYPNMFVITHNHSDFRLRQLTPHSIPNQIILGNI